MSDLVTFAELPDVIQKLGRRRILRWAKEGMFPRAVYLGGYSEPLFSARQASDWLAAKLATGKPPALEVAP
jgi:hypothetical protein